MRSEGRPHHAWEKRGLIFNTDAQRPWMTSHAAVPFARMREGTIYEVLFSCRDRAGRSQVASVLIDIERPQEILELSSVPLLVPGNLGEFDDSGAMLSWISPSGIADRNYWYYIGWNLGVTVPFRNSIGMAIEQSGGSQRAFAGPILDRSRDEPHFVASCCVLREPEGWRMYYLSCVAWSMTSGKARHHYHIKYAESDDGLEWRRPGTIAIDFSSPEEYAISRPSVIGTRSDGYRMWYSHRGTAYRIGYAESDDGIIWDRLDQAVGIDVSESGWDSDMLCYPHVVVHDDRELLFYNGNDYGRSGFGLAVRALR